MYTSITIVGNTNLRVAVCPDTHNEVVQIKDGDEWLCCHCDNEEDTAEDVASFIDHPDAENRSWNNQFLKSVQRQQIDYEI